MYIGTNQGVFYTSWPMPSTDTPQSLPSIPELSGQTWTLNDIDGTLFCGLDQGAYVIDGLKTQKIASDAGFWLFKKCPKHPDGILAGNYTGLYIIRKVASTWMVKKIRGFSESSRMFEFDQDGSVWMSHGFKGVYHLRFNEAMDEVISQEYYGVDQGFPENNHISVFKIQNKIVFTTTQGIYQFNPSSRKMERNAPLNQQLDGNVFYAKLFDPADGSNDIWYIRDKSLVVKNLTTGNVQRSNIDGEILYGFEFLNILSPRSAIVGHENGFSFFDRTQISDQHVEFSNCIRKVFATIPSDSLLWGQSYATVHIQHTTLPFANNSLRFECNIAPFHSDPQIETSYQLENYDNSWMLFPTSGIKEYTNLREGDYRFSLRSVNRATNKVTESSFAFTILPPWYRSPIMYGVYLLIVASLIYLIYYLIGQRIHQNRIHIEALKNQQIEDQKTSFMNEAHEREKEIIRLQADKLQYELKGKSQELANTVMNLVRKNEILNEITLDLQKSCTADTLESARSRLRKLQAKIRENVEHDDDWKRFEENFDIVHDNFMKQLSERFPQLNKSEKKLCAYLRLNLVSKDIAPLLNISVRGVEISRYRLRKKLDLPRDVNLTDFLQNM